MNLRFRFALLFSSFVSVILLISCITVYLLFINYREQEYFDRIANEGRDVNRIFSDIPPADPAAMYRTFRDLHDRALYREKVIICDSAGKLLFRFPDTIAVKKLPVSPGKLKALGEIRTVLPGEDQQVCMYIAETNTLIAVSGNDRTGITKVKTLRFILIVVFVAGVILAVLISLFFGWQALRPLKELAGQMNKVTVQNLTEKIEVPEAGDEISDIARNFNAMRERLSRSFDFQKNFVYHASHELRTPLATMLSQTESALLRDMSVPEYRKTLLSLKEEQQELIELTNSLLLISQFEHMGFALDWPLLRIDELVFETVSSSRKIFPEMQIEIGFASVPDNDDEYTIRGNETLLKSALSNLIKNAYTYSIDQKVGITLDADGKAIFIHIDNAGTQLHADEKENIMIPFFRGGNALTTKGYGLGLSLVYRFIGIHKGTVTYTPVGSDMNRFTIILNRNVEAPKSEVLA
jgi:signal transduction histidine kinase